MRPFTTAATKAAIAPIAELSTKDVQPLMKGIIIAKNINKGNRPALRSFNFTGSGIFRSSTGRIGPSAGLIRQRTAI